MDEAGNFEPGQKKFSLKNAFSKLADKVTGKSEKKPTSSAPSIPAKETEPINQGDRIYQVDDGRLVDARDILFGQPMTYWYNNENGIPENSRSSIMKTRQELKDRNIKLAVLGDYDDQVASLARDLYVSRGTNKPRTSQRWRPLLEKFERLIKCQEYQSLLSLVDSDVENTGYRLNEDVIIGNPQYLHTLTRYRLHALVKQDNGWKAVVMPNTVEDKLRYHMFVGPQEDNPTPDSEKTVLIKTSPREPDSLRRYEENERIYHDNGKPVDLFSIDLDQNIKLWIVTKNPDKAVIIRKLER